MSTRKASTPKTTSKTSARRKKAAPKYTVHISFGCDKNIATQLATVESLVLNRCDDGTTDVVLLCRNGEDELDGCAELVLRCGTAAEFAREQGDELVALNKQVAQLQAKVDKLQAELVTAKKAARRAGAKGAGAGKVADKAVAPTKVGKPAKSARPAKVLVAVAVPVETVVMPVTKVERKKRGKGDAVDLFGVL